MKDRPARSAAYYRPVIAQLRAENERMRSALETVKALAVPMGPEADDPIPPLIAEVLVGICDKALATDSTGGES